MPKYLGLAKYIGKGNEGLLKEGGSSRKEKVRQSIERLGGTLDALYWAFGEHDVVAIADFPDDASAAAFSLMLNSSGTTSLVITPLMTPEDIDEASKKTPAFRPPGQ